MIIKTKTKRLKCWYSNVTSLNNKLDLLAVDLYSNNIDIAFITETWWTASSLKAIKGCSTFHKNREICKGGGVCIFINNNSVKAFGVVDIVSKKFMEIIFGIHYSLVKKIYYVVVFIDHLFQFVLMGTLRF